MCPQSRVHPHLNAPPNTTFLTLICTLLSHHHSPCCQTAGEDLCMDNPAAMLGKLCIMYGISASTLDFKPWKKGISNNLVIWHKKHVVLFKSDSTHWKPALLIHPPPQWTPWDLSANWDGFVEFELGLLTQEESPPLVHHLLAHGKTEEFSTNAFFACMGCENCSWQHQQKVWPQLHLLTDTQERCRLGSLLVSVQYPIISCGVLFGEDYQTDNLLCSTG